MRHWRRVTDRRDPSPAADGRPDRGTDRRRARRGHGRRRSSPGPIGRSSAAPSTPARSGPGNLFVALPGERTDGHRFVAAALAAGAAGVLVARAARRRAISPAVDATIVARRRPAAGALQAVASAWRRRFDPLVVGITGSIAKTSTKEAVAAVLGAAMPTLKNEGNLNNEIGLPLTVLRLRSEHRAAVLEMGMYVGGEIADLARIGRPEIGS